MQNVSQQFLPVDGIASFLVVQTTIYYFEREKRIS